jgi:hypothetical protein
MESLGDVKGFTALLLNALVRAFLLRAATVQYERCEELGWPR